MYVEYDSNNSGGSWWLKDDDWKKLEAAGWKVKWSRLEILYDEKGEYVRELDGTPKLVPIGEGKNKHGSWAKQEKGEYRWLGALACKAYRTNLSLRDAVDEWERVTGKSSTDAGCPCCGNPHNFTEYNNSGCYVQSGPKSAYVASW